LLLSGELGIRSARDLLKPERQSIIKNIGWLAVGNLAVKPFWFLLLLLTARLLGAVEFGQFMLAISIVSIASVVLEGGVDILIVRELSSKPEEYREFFGNSSLLKLFLGIVSGMASIIVCFILKMDWGLLVLVCLASLYSISSTLLLHFRSAFRAFEVLKYEALSTMLEKGSVIVLCGGILLMHLGVRAYMIGYVVAYGLTCTVTLSLILSKLGMPKFRLTSSYLWAHVIKPALPFAVLNLFAIIYFRSGTIMLQALTGSEELVGYYNAGYRLVESFMLFPTIVVAPIYPVISRKRTDTASVKNVMSEAIRALFFIGVSLAVPIFVFRDKITLLLFGEGYRLATNSVGILALTMIPISLNFAAGTLVAALGRQKKSNLFVMVVTFLNLILNYLGIRFFGTEGAAVTTVVTETLLVTCNLFVVHDYISWRSVVSVFLRSVVPAFLASSLTLALIEKISFFFQLSIAVVVMFAGYFFLKLVTLSDIRKMLRMA
jgi:O-antigen/teichoic acid export membrane protein